MTRLSSNILVSGVMHSFYGQHLDLDVLQIKQEDWVKGGHRGNLLQFRRSVTQKSLNGCMLFFKRIHLAAGPPQEKAVIDFISTGQH